MMVIIGIIASTVPVLGAAALWLNNLDMGNPIYYLRAGTMADAGCYVEVLGGPDAEHLQPIVTATGSATEQAVSKPHFCVASTIRVLVGCSVNPWLWTHCRICSSGVSCPS